MGKAIRFVALFLFFLGVNSVASAQFYPTQNRPSGIKWVQLKTDHFRIIYPEGMDSLAYRAAGILEEQYADAELLVGGSLNNFPVILNPKNDLSNGFVTSFNFRSEIEIAAVKGKALNPRSGDWFDTVLPHELVHMMHANKRGGIADVVGVFFPDGARTVHFFAPLGVHEGIAVVHESEKVTETGGRLNSPIFTNRFAANFDSPDRWGMGQTLLTSDFSLPFNRHYIAGSQFTRWLQESFGEDIIKRTIEEHYKAFYLGYGLALKKTTGKSTKELFRLYEADMELKEKERIQKIERPTDDNTEIEHTKYKGNEIHRPVWINENELLVHGWFYNARRGLYTYSKADKKLKLLHETFIVEDFIYTLLDDNTLVYSSYYVHPIYEGNFTADLNIAKIHSSGSRRLTSGGRIFAPQKYGSQIVALQTKEADNRIVFVDPQTGNISRETLSIADGRFINVLPHPNEPQRWAVLANIRGLQGIWFTSPETIESDLLRSADIAFSNASIFDPFWHPKKNELLFSADLGVSQNIFSYRFDEDAVIQLTNSKFNAFEGALSPSGETLAYIIQNGDERKLAFMNAADFINREILRSLWKSNPDATAFVQRPQLGSRSVDSLARRWKKSSYGKDLSWLKPRGIVPVLEDVNGSDLTEFGIGFFSADALQGHSYYAEITGVQNRLWYELNYENKTFYPGFRLKAYSRPFFTRFIVSADGNQFPFTNLVQERGFGLSVPITYRLRSDTRLTSLFIEPEINAEQFRFFNLNGDTNSDFTTRYNIETRFQFNYNILQLPRDVQPAAGFAIFGSSEITLNSPSLTQNLSAGNTRFQVERQFTKPKALFGGIALFASPLRHLNQSLRLDFRFLTQTQNLIYSTRTLVPLGFSDDVFNSFDNNTVRFSSRYTIPLTYPDDGGLTLPLYLSSLYISAFTHTLGNFDDAGFFTNPRTIAGLGFRFRFKLSNLVFDIGTGFAVEPSRRNFQVIIGDF